MKTKLRTTYLVTVLFFLFVTVGSMILFYNMFSEEFIIANNKKIMNLGRIIEVDNQKGGFWKSKTEINISACLA